MSSAKLRFRDYELDPDGFELCRAGHRLRLERKPMELLILLAEKQGQLIKREEIIEKIWGKDFFFDAENGINNAVRKIRSALNDDPEQPRFVETSVGKGYRFITPVQRVLEPASSLATGPLIRQGPAAFRWRRAWVLALGLAAFIATLLVRWRMTGRDHLLRLARFWTKVFAVSFAMGVVSGIVMSYQFGTNWSAFSDKAGPVVGPLMAYEVLAAFFLESGFLGVMLFGLERVGHRLHFFATLMVATGTLISAFWIHSANSWIAAGASRAMISTICGLPRK